VKVFIPGELLAQQARTLNCAFGIYDQAAVRLVMEQACPIPNTTSG